MQRRSFLAVTASAAAMLSFAGSAHANDLEIISAPDALEQVNDGSLILIDVRTEEEWAESGVAAGAATIAMQDRELERKLDALVGGDRSKRVALICRTGVRSGRVGKFMAKAGFTQVYSVGEGMFGSTHGPGWLRRGLPIVQTN